MMIEETPKAEKVFKEKRYHDNGQLFQETSRDIENRLHGVQLVYLDDGSLWSKHPYKHGTLDGKEEFFNDNGEVYKTNVYKDGELISHAVSGGRQTNFMGIVLQNQ